MITPDYNCPACKNPLTIEEVPYDDEQGIMFLFCAHGNCPSMLMNDGVEGSDLCLMHKELVDIWGEEKQDASSHSS